MSHLPEEYSIRGTFVHHYAEMKALECDLPEVPEKYRGFTDGVDRFWEDINPVPLLVEVELKHELLGLIGHLDLITKDVYDFPLYDYKTGSVPQYAGPQLMLYKIMLKRMYPWLGHIPRYAVELSQKGRYKLIPFEDDARDTAIAMEAYHDYLKNEGGAEWSFRVG